MNIQVEYHHQLAASGLFASIHHMEPYPLTIIIFDADKMKRKLLIFIAIITTIIITAQNSTSDSEKDKEPVFTEVTVTTSQSHLLLFGLLENAFTAEMVQGLHSGLDIHFSFFIEIAPSDKSWKDDKLASLETHHVLSYDTLKELYKVEIAESSKRFFTFSDLVNAQTAVKEINGLQVVELSQLEPETSYTVRIRAELFRKTLPMGLHQVVPFVSLWDVKTKWHTISFNL